MTINNRISRASFTLRVWICLFVFLGLNVANFFYLIHSFRLHGYLPEPFIFNKSDTFMDFYNTLYWSSRDGIYTLWQSVYPPINFIFLNIYRLLAFGGLSALPDSPELRRIVGWGMIYPILFYLLLLALTVNLSFSTIFNFRKRMIVICIVFLSSPTLFALERGNLIFLSLYVFALYVWCEKKISKIIVLSFLINIKPYFLLIYIIELIRFKNIHEKKDFLILTPIISLLIFIFFGLLINQEYYLLPFNLLGFASKSDLIPAEVMSFPVTILAWSHLNGFINEVTLPFFISYIPKVLVYGTLLLTLKIILQNKVNNNESIIFITLFLTNYSISSGGYSVLYYLPIIPLLYISKNYLILLTLVCSIYLGIWDQVVLSNAFSREYEIYLSGIYKLVNINFVLGSLVKPLGNYLALLFFYQMLRKKYVN
jgi:hypothetical protein